MSQNGILTRKQTKAISSLLACQTIAQAAKMAGVSDRTLYRWLNEDAFTAELQRAGRQTVTGALRRLIAGRDAALDTLHHLMTKARSENVRRLAARDWFDILYRTTEIETILERLDALEAVSNGNDQ
jgi:predicted TIM-barrel fold metal-dependent hydrolase